MAHKKLTLFLALVLTLGFLRAEANSITYTFIPDADDSNSQGFGGSITLDVPASNNGQVTEVLGINIYGPYINPESFNSATESLTLFGTFSWNSSTITSMDVNVGNSSFVFGVYDNGLYEAGMDAQANGSWVNLNSSVPDGAETCLLLGLSLATLAALRHGSLRLRAFARR